MKRSATDPVGGSAPGMPTKLQKTASDQPGKGNDEKENGVHDEKSLLQNQNRALAADMRRRQRQEAELEKQLAEAWAKQGHYDATLSAVKRAWDQVLADLNTAAEGLGLGPRPLHVKVEEDEDDDEEGSIKVEILNEMKVPTKDGGEPQSEMSIMEKLLLPAAEVLSMDATDSSCGDKLLKENTCASVSPNKKDETGKGSPRTYLGCMAGTSSALYDLDSDGYGLSSRENVKELVPSTVVSLEEVEKGLREKARLTAELAGRLFQAMQAHLTSLPPEERKTSLDVAQLELLAQKRKLEAERTFLSDQLTQARARSMELSESITNLREDYRKANRKLDRLAAEGVYIEAPTENSASGSGAGGGPRSGAGGNGMMPPPAPLTPKGSMSGIIRGINNRGDAGELAAALQETEALSESRQKEAERLRLEKLEAEKEITRLKATTDLDTSKTDLSAHPQFQRLGTQLAAEQDMLNLEKTRVTELEGQLTQMAAQVQQHEMALQQQMEQQRLRWKSEIVASNSMLNTAHEDLDKAQAKLRQEQRVGSSLLQSAYVQRDEMNRLLQQTEQQVSILKASLERATKAKEHAEAQAAKDRARLDKQGGTAGGTGSKEDENWKAKLADISRQLAGSKAIEDALQSELNTTLAAYAQSKEGNQKLVQEITRISHSQKELSDEVSSAKAQLKNRHQVRATMELQIKTAAQMRDQGHALKQKALDLVAEAERKLQQERTQNLELTREVHTEKAHADRARQEVDALTQAKQAVESAHGELKEHCDNLHVKFASMEEQLDRAKEQSAALTRKVEKVRSHNARLISLTEGANNKEAIDEEIREEELLELRKMIKCSVCQDRKKNRVITKCYHMFCDECVSQNLKTRNRKCPACAKPFGQDDVHELWLT